MTDNRPGILSTLVRQAKQGASLGLADEVQDVGGSLLAKVILEVMRLSGKDVGDAKFADILSSARTRSGDELSNDWQTNPATAVAGNIAGAVPFLLGQAGLRATLGAAKAPAAATASANALAKFNQGLQAWAATGGRLARAGRGAAVGAGYGAVSGAGSAGDSIEERARGAMLGTAIGSAGGAAGGAISRGNPTVENVSGAVAKRAGQNQAEREFIRQLAMRPDLPAMARNAQSMQGLSKQYGVELTLPELLAQTDIDPLLARQSVLAKAPETTGDIQALLQRRMGTMQQPGQIQQAVNRTANTLAPGSYDDLAQQLLVSGREGANRITQNLSKQASPLYREAFSANRSIASPELDRILETPAGRAALANARTILQNEGTRLGIPDKELGEIARELGIKSQGGIAAGLKLETYDLIKRSLQDMSKQEWAGTAPGRDNPLARSYDSLSQRLISELDNLDVTGITGPNSTRPDGGAYARARAVYSSQPEVLADRRVMAELADIDKLSPEQVLPQLYGGTPATAQRTAQALGEGSRAAAAAKLQSIIGDLKQGRFPPNLDNDTMAMLRSYAGQDAGLIDNLLSVVDRARMGERYLRGSQTAPLTQTSANMANEAGNAVIDAATGNHTGLIRRGVGAAARLVGAGQGEQYNQDLLNLMTTPRGMQAVNEAVRVQRDLLTRPANTAITLPATNSVSGVVQRYIGVPRVSSGYVAAQLPLSNTLIQAGSTLPDGFTVREEWDKLPSGFRVRGANQ